MSVVKKRKHVSKKNKKAWRKYCDIGDVEEFLEDQRLDERLGKLATKQDSELFMVDTSGGNEGSNENTTSVPTLSLKQRKRLNIREIPRCFEILLPASKVPDPIVKRNHVKPFGTRLTALSKLTENRKQAKGILAKRLEEVKKSRKLALNKKRKLKEKNYDLDLWGGDLPEIKTIPKGLQTEWLPPEAQIHNVLPDRRLLTKPLSSKRLTAPAVAAPHPGVSYNPTYKEHQELLTDVVKHEGKLIEKEKHLHRVTTGMFSKVTPQEKESQWTKEMSSGLPESKDKEPEASEDESNEYKAINPPVKNKKKDHKARRKQREQLIEKEKLKRKKIEKKKITDIYKLRQLEAKVEKLESKSSAAREKRHAARILRSTTAPPALNAHKVQPLEPNLVEPSELSGNLRNIRSNVNLLKERYQSLQHRGALAGARIQMKKKRRVKGYFKPGHKVTEQDVKKYLDKQESDKVV